MSDTFSRVTAGWLRGAVERATNGWVELYKKFYLHDGDLKASGARGFHRVCATRFRLSVVSARGGIHICPTRPTLSINIRQITKLSVRAVVS